MLGGLIFALSMGGAATPPQRPTAADFMAMCAPLAKMQATDIQKALAEVQRGGSYVREDMAAISALTYCGTLLDGIVTAIGNADHYSIQGRRVCLDPDRPALTTLGDVIAYGKAHPEAASGDKPAESLVMAALSEHPCPAE